MIRAIIVLLLLVCGELALREIGWRPNARTVVGSALLPDPELGWINASGNHSVLNNASGAVHRETIWPDGSRATSVGISGQDPSIAILGCSLFFGYGLSDDETLAWKLQEKFPAERIGNYAVPGYGTLQALLTMEKLLRRQDKPKLFLYGFFSDHENRNIAHPDWVHAAAFNSSSLNTAFPYCSSDPAGGCLRQPSANFYLELPFRHRFGVVLFIEELWMRLRSVTRVNHGPEVTQHLLREMHDTALANGARVTIVLLDSYSTSYAPFLEREGISYANCYRPEHDTVEYHVAGDPHPNGRTISNWAECLLSLDLPSR